MQSRIPLEQYFMAVTEAVSKRATCCRAHMGAIIVNSDSVIVSTGFNGAPRGLPHCDEVGCQIEESNGEIHCVRTSHAEENAIVQAARSGVSTKGCVMYAMTCPCFNCAKLVINAGIEAVYYKNEYQNDKGKELLKKAGIKIMKVV